MLEKLKNEFVQGRMLLQFGFLQTFGYATAMLISLVVAKFFSRELFGKYSISEMVVYFFVTLFVILPRMPFIVYANEERVATGGIRKSASIQLIFVGTGLILFSLTCLFFGNFLMRFAHLDRPELLCVAVAFFGLLLKDLFSSLFMALNERIKSAFIEPAYGVFALVILFGLYFAGLMSFKSAFLTYFASSVIVCFICLWFVNFRVVTPLTFDKQHFIRMGKFTLWMVFGIMSGYLIDWNGIAILKKYVSIGDLGEFNLAYKFFKGFMAIVYILPNYFLPHISESINIESKIRFYLYHKRPVIFLLGLLCLITAFFIIPYFISFVFGDKYPGAIPILRILIFGVGPFLYAAFYLPIMGVKERYKFIQVAGVTQVALNIALNLVLIPRMGTYGAAIATVIAYVYLLLLYEGYFRLKLAKIVMPKPS